VLGHHHVLRRGLAGVALSSSVPGGAAVAGVYWYHALRRYGASNRQARRLLVVITLAGAHKLWPFLAIAVVAGIASATTNPAGRSLTPEIVPPELLPGAVALRSVATQAGIVVGPALGGLIFAVEPVAVYITAATLFALAVVAILGVTARVAVAPPTEVNWQTLSAGIGFIVRTRMLLVAGCDWEGAIRAHREVFAGIDPANTTYFVAGFIPEGVLVEVELDAVVPAAPR